MSNDLYKISSQKLEQLFGSKTRVKLLILFLKNQDKSFFVRELTRMLKVQINSVRRELKNLVDIGMIQQVTEGDKPVENYAGLKEKKYYKLNPNYFLLEELKNLFVKSRNYEEQDYINRLAELKGMDYLALTGFFTQLPIDSVKIDMLAVGDFNKDEFIDIVSKLQRHIGKEINYTAMTNEEFQYRNEISDKFLYDILANKKIVVKNNLDIISKNLFNNND
jgi:hypothetical protein